MNERSLLSAAVLLVAVVVAGILLYPIRRDEAAPPVPGEASDPVPETAAPVREWTDPLRGRVGEGLNAPGGTVAQDLLVLQSLLAAWRSNARDHGNPVGTNREITATLAGRNPWKLEVIPPDHPAINDAGELCDRWGTPVFFHQLGGGRMELRSSGPDRERFTADDVVLTP